MQNAIRTRAKRAFVLADWLKGAPFDAIEEFQAVFAAEKSKVQQLLDADLDRIIGIDPKRLRDYNKATWKLGPISLTACSVYPAMGGRPWAIGSVRDVAEQFKRWESPTSRIWTMKRFSNFFEDELPILVLKKNSTFGINDGSHRAIAVALCGVEQVTAWIGEL